MNLPFKFAKMNRIRIKDSDLDAFRDFFNCHYDGSPMPHVFDSEILVEVTDRKDKVIFTVDYPDEYMSIKCYMESQFVMELLIHEVKVEKGKYGYPINRMVVRNEAIFSRVPKKVADRYTDEMSIYCIDVVRYVILFYHFNRDKVNVKYEDVNMKQKPSSNKNGKKRKKNGTASKRRTVYVPNIVKLKKAMEEEQNVAVKEEANDVWVGITESEIGTSSSENIAIAEEKTNVLADITESKVGTSDSENVAIAEEKTNVSAADTVEPEKTGNNRRAPAKYTKPEWERAGCTYVNKKGTVVTRKPTVCQRRKELAKEGVDFVLRPTKAEMT